MLSFSPIICVNPTTTNIRCASSLGKFILYVFLRIGGQGRTETNNLYKKDTNTNLNNELMQNLLFGGLQLADWEYEL